MIVSQIKPAGVGLFMGLAMPWMMHMDAGEALGLWFVIAHFAAALTLMAALLALPRLRSHLKRKRKHFIHMPVMLGFAALGWAATCGYCLLIGGQHWT